MMTRKLYLLLAVLFFSFKPDDTTTADLSAIAVRLTYSSLGISGKGGRIAVRNVATGKVFTGESRGLNPYVIVENVPPGTYQVEMVNIIYGPNVMALGDRALFNTIKIDSPKAYYIGSYITRKVPPMMKMNVVITRTGDDDVRQIAKQLKKRSDHTAGLSVDTMQHLFALDSMGVSIRR